MGPPVGLRRPQTGRRDPRIRFLRNARRRRIDRFRGRVLKNGIHDQIFAENNAKQASVQSHYMLVRASERQFVAGIERLMGLAKTWGGKRRGRRVLRKRQNDYVNASGDEEGKGDEETEDEEADEDSDSPLDLSDDEMEADLALNLLLESLQGGAEFTATLSLTKRKQLVDDAKVRMERLVSDFLTLSRQAPFRGFGNWISRRSKGLDGENRELEAQLDETCEAAEEFAQSRDEVEDSVLKAEFREFRALNAFYEDLQKRTLVLRAQARDGDVTQSRVVDPHAAQRGYELQKGEVHKHELRVQLSVVQSQIEEKQQLLDIRQKRMEMLRSKALTEEEKQQQLEKYMDAAQLAYEKKANRFLELINSKQLELTDLKSKLKRNKKEIESLNATIQATGDDRIIKSCKRQVKELDGILAKGEPRRTAKAAASKVPKALEAHVQAVEQGRRAEGSTSDATAMAQAKLTTKIRRMDARSRKTARAKSRKRQQELEAEIQALHLSLDKSSSRSATLRKTIANVEASIKHRNRKTRKEIQKQNEIKQLQSSLAALVEANVSGDRTVELDMLRERSAQQQERLATAESEVRRLRAQLEELEAFVADGLARVEAAKHATARRSGKFDAALTDDLMACKGEVEHHSNVMSEFVSLRDEWEKEQAVVSQLAEEAAMRDQDIAEVEFALLRAEEEMAIFDLTDDLESASDYGENGGENGGGLVGEQVEGQNQVGGRHAEAAEGARQRAPRGFAALSPDALRKLDLHVVMCALGPLCNDYAALGRTETREVLKDGVQLDSRDLAQLEEDVQLRYVISKLAYRLRAVCAAKLDNLQRPLEEASAALAHLETELGMHTEVIQQEESELSVDKANLDRVEDDLHELQAQVQVAFDAMVEASAQASMTIPTSKQLQELDIRIKAVDSLVQGSDAVRTRLRDLALKVEAAQINLQSLEGKRDEVFLRFGAALVNKQLLEAKIGVLQFVDTVVKVVSLLDPSDRVVSILQDVGSRGAVAMQLLSSLEGHAEQLDTQGCLRLVHEATAAGMSLASGMDSAATALEHAASKHKASWQVLMENEEAALRLLPKGELPSALLEVRAAMRADFVASSEVTREVDRKGLILDEKLSTTLSQAATAKQEALGNYRRNLSAGMKKARQALEKHIDEVTKPLNMLVGDVRDLAEQDIPAIFVATPAQLAAIDAVPEAEAERLMALHERALQAAAAVDAAAWAEPEDEKGKAMHQIERAATMRKEALGAISGLEGELLEAERTLAYCVDAGEPAEKIEMLEEKRNEVRTLLEETREQAESAKHLEASAKEHLGKLQEEKDAGSDDVGTAKAEFDGAVRAQSALILKRDQAFLDLVRAHVAGMLRVAHATLDAVPESTRAGFISLLRVAESAYLRVGLDRMHEAHVMGTPEQGPADISPSQETLAATSTMLNGAAACAFLALRTLDLVIGRPGRTAPVAHDLRPGAGVVEASTGKDGESTQSVSGTEDQACSVGALASLGGESTSESGPGREAPAQDSEENAASDAKAQAFASERGLPRLEEEVDFVSALVAGIVINSKEPGELYQDAQGDASTRTFETGRRQSNGTAAGAAAVPSPKVMPVLSTATLLKHTVELLEDIAAEEGVEDETDETDESDSCWESGESGESNASGEEGESDEDDEEDVPNAKARKRAARGAEARGAEANDDEAVDDGEQRKRRGRRGRRKRRKQRKRDRQLHRTGPTGLLEMTMAKYERNKPTSRVLGASDVEAALYNRGADTSQDELGGRPGKSFSRVVAGAGDATTVTASGQHKVHKPNKARRRSSLGSRAKAKNRIVAAKSTRAQVAELRAKANDLRKRRSVVESRLAEANKKLDTLSETKKSTEQLLAAFSNEDQRYLHTIADLKGKIQESVLAIADMELENEELVAEHAMLKSATESFEVSAENVLDENKASYADLVRMEKEGAKLEKEKEQLRVRLLGLENLDTIDATPESTIGQLRMIREQHEKATKSVHELKSRVAQQTESLEREDPGPGLLRKAHTLRRENAAMQNELRELTKTTLDSASLAHKARVTAIREEREKLEKEIAELELRLGKRKKRPKSRKSDEGGAGREEDGEAEEEDEEEVVKDDEELDLERRLRQYEKQVDWWQKRWAANMDVTDRPDNQIVA